MATGHATIRGRAGTSASGKKVSQYSPQYRQTTGQEAADRGTTSASIALSDLTTEQKQIANTLGLSKAQVLALNQRQLSQLSYNLKYASPWKVQQLSRMYGNVSTHQLIQSGRSGMSKVDVMKYNRALDQKSFGTGVSIKKAERIIPRNSPESRVTTLKQFDSQTGTYKIPTSTLQNLSGKVRSAGDYQAVLNIAKKSMFTASRSEKERIVAARNYILSISGGNRQQNYDYFVSLEYSLASQLPITANTSQKDQNTILKARQWLLKNTPAEAKDYTKAWFSYMDKSGNKISLEKYVSGIYNAKKDKTVKQSSPVFENEKEEKEFYAKRKEEYQARLKKEEMEKELEKYAGDSTLKQALADIYEATYDISNLQKTFSRGNRKTEYSITRPLIEKPVNKVSSKLEKTESYKNLGKAISKDPALKAISEFAKDEYKDLTKKPLTYGAEVIALAGMGKAFKIGDKALKAGVGKTVGKVIGKKTTNVLIDTGYVAQIGKQVVENSDKNGNYITKANLELAKDLAIMGAFARGGKTKEVKEEPLHKSKSEHKPKNKIKKLIESKTKKPTSEPKPTTKPKSTKPKSKPKVESKPKTRIIEKSPSNANEDQIIISELIRDSSLAQAQSKKLPPQAATGKKTKGLSDTVIVRQKPILELVEYKGKVFSVPGNIKGTKRQLLLKKMYEGKTVNATPAEIAAGKISRKQLKSKPGKVKPKDVNEDVKTVYLTDLLFTGGPRLFPLKVKPKTMGDVRPKTQNVKAKTSTKNQYINSTVNTKVNKALQQKYSDYRKAGINSRLTTREIALVKTGVKSRIRQISRPKERAEILSKIRIMPLSTVKNAVDVLEVVRVAEKSAVAVKAIQTPILKTAQMTAAKPRVKSSKPALKRVAQKKPSTKSQSRRSGKKGKGSGKTRGFVLPDIIPPVPGIKRKPKTTASQKTTSRRKGKTVRTNVIGSILETSIPQKKTQKSKKRR